MVYLVLLSFGNCFPYLIVLTKVYLVLLGFTIFHQVRRFPGIKWMQ